MREAIRREKKTRDKSEKRNPVENGREIPVVCLDTFVWRGRRVGDDDFGLSSTTRCDGEVVGRRKVAVPQGRRSTDCNVARNYVSAVSTADIPPNPLSPHAAFRPCPPTCILPRPQPQEFGVNVRRFQEKARFPFSISAFSIAVSYAVRSSRSVKFFSAKCVNCIAYFLT